MLCQTCDALYEFVADREERVEQRRVEPDLGTISRKVPTRLRRGLRPAFRRTLYDRTLESLARSVYFPLSHTRPNIQIAEPCQRTPSRAAPTGAWRLPTKPQGIYLHFSKFSPTPESFSIRFSDCGQFKRTRARVLCRSNITLDRHLAQTPVSPALHPPNPNMLWLDAAKAPRARPAVSAIRVS